MNEQEKTPLQQNTKDDSSDVERVKQDKAEAAKGSSAPPQPEGTKEEEEAEKGHS